MTSIHRWQLAVLLALLIDLGFCHQVVAFQQDERASTKSSPPVFDISLLMSMANDDPFESKYFVDEINIVQDQKQKIRKCFDNGLNDAFKIVGSVVKPTDRSNAQPARVKLAKLSQKMGSEFGEILLPDQLEGLVGLIRQRALIKQKGYQAFDIVRVEKLDLGFSGDEREKFDKESLAFSKEYLRARNQTRDKAWKKIMAKMPDDAQARLQKILPALQDSSSFVRKTGQLKQSDIKKWSEEEFDTYELSCFQSYISASFHSPDLASELGILDYQTKQMDEIIKRPIAPDRELTRKKQDLEKMKREAMARGDLALMQEWYKQNKTLETREREQVINRAAQEVLLPEQLEVINSVAKFKRLTIDPKHGDEFGAVVAWTESLSQHGDLKELRTIAAKCKTDYYETRKKLWSKTSADIWNLLSANSQQQFKSKFGEFYDYEQEVREDWLKK